MESTERDKKKTISSPLPIAKRKLSIHDNSRKPFWNNSTLIYSKKLWLPKKSNCIDVDSVSLGSSTKRLTQNTWFSFKTQQKTDTTTILSSSINVPVVIHGKNSKERKKREKKAIYENLPPKKEKKS